MSPEEKDAVDMLPDKFKPLSMWKYFGLSILFSLPVIGWIFIIVFAVDGSNVNRRNYARSFLCVLIIAAVIIALCCAFALPYASTLVDQISSLKI